MVLCTLITVQIKSAVLIAVALWTLQPRNLAPLPDYLSTSLAHSVCPWRFSESPDQHQREFLCSGSLIRERSLLPFIFSVSLHYLGFTGKIKRFEQLGNNKALTVHKEQVKGCLEYLSIPVPLLWGGLQTPSGTEQAGSCSGGTWEAKTKNHSRDHGLHLYQLFWVYRIDLSKVSRKTYSEKKPTE